MAVGANRLSTSIHDESQPANSVDRGCHATSSGHQREPERRHSPAQRGQPILPAATAVKLEPQSTALFPGAFSYIPCDAKSRSRLVEFRGMSVGAHVFVR